MIPFRKRYTVSPNTTGYLYRNQELSETLKPGNYSYWDPKLQTHLISLPDTSKQLTILNQEVLTKDNIALRFSFSIVYKIVDGSLFLSMFPLDRPTATIIAEAENRITNIVQVAVRNTISGIDSENLNETRNSLNDINSNEIGTQVAAYGISIESTQIRDITFPKAVQDLFMKTLESKIRAKTELENARTAVASARALKNVSELMKDDDNIKFYKMIETISKIAEKGKHTFVIGDVNQMTKK